MTDATPHSAVVTGAAKGIGRAVAEHLVADGFHVAGLDRDAEGLSTAAAELGARFTPVDGDISDWDAHERAADAAEATAPLRGWVNNAGVDLQGAAGAVDQEHIDRGLKILLAGPMYGTAVAVRRMLASGSGSIVNVSSIHARAAFPRYYIYDAAKAGIVMATKSVALDYGPSGLRANVVLPGSVATPMTFDSIPPTKDRAEALREEGELSPLGRIAEPNEIAAVVAFLISEDASFVNGAEVVADGGAIAGFIDRSEPSPRPRGPR
jgi:NAD(P)-dependent dehydrogenase (short-subunit alcohol dehydrogenase family)